MCRSFSLSALKSLSQCRLLQNTILKDQDKIKIADKSVIKFLIMACKLSLLLLNKINVLLLALIYCCGAYGATKEKKDLSLETTERRIKGQFKA